MHDRTRKILELLSEGTHSQSEIARMVGVSRGRVSHLALRRKYERAERPIQSCVCGHVYATPEPHARPAETHFWPFVHKTDTCWLWTGGGGGRTYGRGNVDPFGTGQAHRISYRLNVGPIADGLLVLHSCDRPACVNPAHLRLGTHQDNVNDAVSRRRYRHG